MYIHMCMSVYTYIYIWRERESIIKHRREEEKEAADRPVVLAEREEETSHGLLC